jgi:hypothetical protein
LPPVDAAFTFLPKPPFRRRIVQTRTVTSVAPYFLIRSMFPHELALLFACWRGDLRLSIALATAHANTEKRYLFRLSASHSAVGPGQRHNVGKSLISLACLEPTMCRSNKAWVLTRWLTRSFPRTAWGIRSRPCSGNS